MVLASRVSESCDDPAWDEFLQSSPLGHYQQSGLWARAKSFEGWRPLRMVYMRAGAVVGGFQLLHKRKPAGRVAYISKGPAISADDPALWDLALQDIRRAVKDTQIRALIVQEPDLSQTDRALWSAAGFFDDNLMQVITSTLLFDFTERLPAARGIHPEHLRKVRQARKRGVTVREGSRGDIDLFFKLMLMTCRRQGETQPNPASAEALRAIWDAFAAAGCIRLTIAELDGTPLAGQLNFIFGSRISLYKKGWSADHAECRPNHLLTYEILEWSRSRGAALVDCLAFDRTMAETILAGRQLTARHRQSRDMFNYYFGGTPVLLPLPHVLIPNTLARSAYKLAQTLPSIRAALRNCASRSRSGV